MGEAKVNEDVKSNAIFQSAERSYPVAEVLAWLEINKFSLDQWRMRHGTPAARAREAEQAARFIGFRA